MHRPQTDTRLGTPLFCLAVLMHTGCSDPEKKAAGSTGSDTTTHAEYTNTPVPLAADQTTRLDFSSTPGTLGGVGQLKALGNMAMRWDDAGTLTWKIDVPADGEYTASLAYSAIKAGAVASLYTDKEQIQTTLRVPTAPMDEPLRLSDIADANMRIEYLYAYGRHAFSEPILLQAGTHDLSLTIDNLRTDEVIDFRALELTSVDATAAIEAEAVQAQEGRADTSWMVDAKYGVMFHWTDMTVNEDGSQLDYKAAVEQFDVAAFGDLSEQVGAGYVIFTLNHQYPHCPAPIEAWENIHPGWTTERDLIAEIAEDLQQRDIKLILYLASHLVGNPDDVHENKWLWAHRYGSNLQIPTATHFDIFENNKTVLTAIGQRYGTQVAGFWLDGWDIIPEAYPHPDFRELYDASKTGSPDRVMTLNRWIFPTVTPWQDHWAGEIDSPDKLPTEQFMTTDVGGGLQYHALIAMEDDWVYTQEGLEDGPRFYKSRYKADELVEYIEDAHAVKGAVTINLAIRQDLSLVPSALEAMEEVKAQLR
jgi:hypothetical protein